MTHILIIEDEPIIREALSRLLQRNDYTTSEAGSVQEALSQYDINSFNLIISDVRLPGDPGTAIIEHAGSIPVLIMTSYASVDSAVEAMRIGAAHYIAKPFDHNIMLSKVSQIITEHQKNQAASPDNVSIEEYFQRFVIENQDKMSETELANKLGISRKSLWEKRQRLGIPKRR